MFGRGKLFKIFLVTLTLTAFSSLMFMMAFTTKDNLTIPVQKENKIRTKPAQIFRHEFADNYQHQPYVHLDYAQTMRTIKGKIYNPPGDRSNVVEDENYGIKSSTNQCKNKPPGLMPPFNERDLKVILHNQLDEYEIISKTFATHLEDYPVPRKLNQYIPKDLCTKYSNHDRLLMCSPTYRAGEKRIIGINQPCYYFQYVAKTNCKFVDPGTGTSAVPGTIFNSTHWFLKDWSERSGVKYFNQTVKYFDKIIAGPLTYWNTHSHLPLEFLPRFLYLIEVLPKDIPVLGSTKGFAGQYFKYMIDMKILDPKRIIEFNPSEYVFGKEVYFSRDYPPCQNDCQRQYSLEFHGRLKRMMVPVDLPVEERDTIIYVHRQGSRSLSPDQANALEAMLKKYGKVVRFDGKQYPLLKDVVDLFKKAKIVISTHG
jgi:hypothetical protein